MTHTNDTSDGRHEMPQPRPWDDAAVPLESRGVSCQWLIDFVLSISKEINAPSYQAIQNSPSHPAIQEDNPYIPPFYCLTTHGLVSRVIKPLTASLKAPLYALVPDEFRGRPTTFVSHTWSSLLLGSERQRIGTLDALELELLHTFVWIDFVCYNQHTFEAIATDMLRVIRAIGSLSVCATPTPIYSRSWCLWELLCAHRAEAEVSLLVRTGYRNDKIMSVNALYRSFKGIEKAASSVPADREMIHSECISHFGSVERADSELERIIRERFSSSWHELQDKNDRLKFSPSPWVAGSSGVAPAAFEPYFAPVLLDSRVFGSDRTVRKLFFETGVYLGSRNMAIVQDAQLRTTWNRADSHTQDFFRCLLSGDAAGVKKHLDLGCVPDAVLSGLTPITIAARRGDVAMVEMLITAGAPIEQTNTSFSPLRLAADNGHHEVVRLLLRHGTAVDASDKDDGWTALIWASSSGHDEIVKTLLESGADVNHAGSGKRATALHLAAQNGRTEVIQTLLAHGAEVDAREYRDLTALHLGAHNGHAEIVRILLSHGADRTVLGSPGKTAQEMAEERGHRHVVEVFTSGV